MKNLAHPEIDQYRVRTAAVVAHYSNIGDGTCGVFDVPSPLDGYKLRIVASAEGSWDHVSVSRPHRCPNWLEMDHVKRLFFEDGETAVQFHVPTADHISHHPYCLHLWRLQVAEFPRPPAWMVA